MKSRFNRLLDKQCICCVFSFELVGGLPHTVGCNMKSRFNRLLEKHDMLRFFI